MNQSFTNYAITREQFDAVLSDLDGVLTDTSSLHPACWKKIRVKFDYPDLER